MSDMKINILIRMSAGREEVFSRCINSISKQSYNDINLIISFDFIPTQHSVKVLENSKIDYTYFLIKKPDTNNKFFYNDYCNGLMSFIKSGWFFFLDSDDYLANDTVLENIVKDLSGNAWQAVVCQMTRDNGKTKPSDELISAKKIESGKVALPCLLLRAQYKDMLKIGMTENADFEWIKAVSESVATKFVKKVMVHSPKRSFGQ